MVGIASRGLVLVIGCAVALGLAEISVRVAGWEPREAPRDRSGPEVFEPHPSLGWAPVAGRHRLGEAGTDAIVHTITDEGHRATSYSGVDAERELVLTGGSFTEGWEVSDKETFAWRLQRSLPHWKIVNLGVSGYGTYQSLIRLRHELPALKNPRFVLYGFIDHHEQRNVGSLRWLRAIGGSGGGAKTPRAGVGEDGSIEHHGLAGFLNLPLRSHSALVTLLEDAWMTHRVGELDARWRDVTKGLLLEMNEVAKQHGAEFAVVFLHSEDRTVDRLVHFLGDNGIASVDCAVPLTEEMRVGGKGHPNWKTHRRWATCIRRGLPDAVTAASHEPHGG